MDYVARWTDERHGCVRNDISWWMTCATELVWLQTEAEERSRLSSVVVQQLQIKTLGWYYWEP